jgi:glycosyltransferase involved in cell wall biosynthesis
MNKSLEKRVLVISYKFPPINSPGVYRILGFIRHLPKYNFEPIIVTARNPYGDVKDMDLLKEVPKEVTVYRTFSFEIERFKEKLYLFLFKKKEAGKPGNMNSFERIVDHPKNENIFFSIFRFLFDNLFIPDTRIGWIPTAFFRSLMICLTGQVDLIFTSSPPDSLHLVGFFIKKFTKKKWVVDFRDPWGSSQGLRLRNKIVYLMEKSILKNADFIIANSPGMKELIMEKYGFVKEKIVVITNGFDTEFCGDLNQCVLASGYIPGEKLNITFIGNVYSDTMFGICEALKELKAEDNKLSSKIIINIVGLIPEQERSFVEEHGINDLVNYRGFVSHSQINSYLEKANVLLVLLPQNYQYRGWIPSKIFNYISLGKPILALIPEGDAKDILEKTRTGICVDPNDIARIKIVIKNLINAFENKNLKIDPDRVEINKYDRKKLTKDLVEVFNEVLYRN